MQQTVDWASYWVRKNPGFHEGKVNAYLQQYLSIFSLQPGDTVFMPLCGKAVDILWIARQGYHVVGVELCAPAIESFFEESRLDYEIESSEHFDIYRSLNITLYQGDFMHLTAQQLEPCHMVYDRASIVAIESFNRRAYVNHMLEIVPEGVSMLLISLDYDQAVMQGPPFSVPVSEIYALYDSIYRIELLQSCEQIEQRPRWREFGLKSLTETALSLTKA